MANQGVMVKMVLKKLTMSLLLMLFFSHFSSVYAIEESAAESVMSAEEKPVYPGYSIEIVLNQEPDAGDCYMQNVDFEAGVVIADMEEQYFQVYGRNQGEAELEDAVITVRKGDAVDTVTASEGVKYSPGQNEPVYKGELVINEKDVERGYMIIHADCTLQCKDPMYADTVTVSDEIVIRVCARPEKDIVSYLSTIGGEDLSEEDRLSYLKWRFGDRYEEMRDRVMAEESREGEKTEAEETEKPGGGREQEHPQKGRIIMIAVLLFGIAFTGAVILMIRKNRRRS